MILPRFMIRVSPVSLYKNSISKIPFLVYVVFLIYLVMIVLFLSVYD